MAVVEIGKVHVGVDQGSVVVRMSMRPGLMDFMFVPVLVPDRRETTE